jgi:hypothetical protein
MPKTVLLLTAIAMIAGAAPAPANGLLCGSGWHYSYYDFKCIRNRHHCPAGKHWISLLKVCV